MVNELAGSDDKLPIKMLNDRILVNIDARAASRRLASAAAGSLAVCR